VLFVTNSPQVSDLSVILPCSRPPSARFSDGLDSLDDQWTSFTPLYRVRGRSKESLTRNIQSVVLRGASSGGTLSSYIQSQYPKTQRLVYVESVVLRGASSGGTLSSHIQSQYPKTQRLVSVDLDALVSSMQRR